MQQQGLPFEERERDSLFRLQELKAIAREVGPRDPYARLFLIEIFHRTAMGHPNAKPFPMEVALICDAIGAGSTTVHRVIKLCEQRSVITVDRPLGPNTINGYAIHWPGVFKILRRPAPEYCHPWGAPSEERSSPSEERSSPSEERSSPSEERGVVSYSTPTHACAPVALLALLALSDVDVVVSQADWNEVLRTCQQAVSTIWPRDPKPLSERERELLLSAAVISKKVLSEDWLRGALAIVSRRRDIKNPLGYLRSVLVARCWETEGKCAEEQAAGYFAALMRLVRPVVQAHEARRQKNPIEA